MAVINLYDVVEGYKKLGKYYWLVRTRKALMHQEMELRDKNSLERMGICILCGHEKPRKNEEEEGEWR